MGQSGCIESIQANGEDLPLISGGTPEYRAYLLKNSDDNAWYFNENIRVSFIKVFDNNPSINIIMKLN
jgi:alpha-glucosidase